MPKASKAAQIIDAELEAVSGEIDRITNHIRAYEERRSSVRDRLDFLTDLKRKLGEAPPEGANGVQKRQAPGDVAKAVDSVIVGMTEDSVTSADGIMTLLGSANFKRNSVLEVIRSRVREGILVKAGRSRWKKAPARLDLPPAGAPMGADPLAVSG